MLWICGPPVLLADGIVRPIDDRATPTTGVIAESVHRPWCRPLFLILVRKIVFAVIEDPVQPFFGACNLQCMYCQNWNISANDEGVFISNDHLAEIM